MTDIIDDLKQVVYAFEDTKLATVIERAIQEISTLRATVKRQVAKVNLSDELNGGYNYFYDGEIT